jgi:hypothetical protein
VTLAVRLPAVFALPLVGASMDPLAHLQQPHSAPSSSASASFAAPASAASSSAPAQTLAGAPSLVVSHEASQQQQLDADHFGIPCGFDPSSSSLGPEQQQHFPSLSPGVDSTGE